MDAVPTGFAILDGRTTRVLTWTDGLVLLGNLSGNGPAGPAGPAGPLPERFSRSTMPSVDVRTLVVRPSRIACPVVAASISDNNTLLFKHIHKSITN